MNSVITKRSIKYNGELILKLPEIAQKLFKQDLNYTKKQTHDLIWRQFFSESNPSYEEIISSFEVMKSTDEYTPYPLIINDNKVYTLGIQIQTRHQNYFVINLMNYANPINFWDKIDDEFITENIVTFQSVSYDKIKINRYIIRVIRIVGQYNYWYSIYYALTKDTFKKYPELTDIIETNFKYYYEETAFLKNTECFFNLIKLGARFSDSFLISITNENQFLLKSEGFTSLITEANIDRSSAKLYKMCKSKVERKNMLDFIDRITNHEVYVVISLY